MRIRQVLLASGAALAVVIATIGTAAAEPGQGLSSGTPAQDTQVAAHGMGTGKDHLSPRLTALSAPSLADASIKTQAAAVSLPASGPTSIPRGPDDSLRVEIVVADTSDSAIEILRERGAVFLHVSTRYSTITATVPAQDLRSVGSAPGVISVTEVLTPHLGRSAASVGVPATGVSAKGSAATCGVLVSDASSQLKAATARARFNVDGAGLKVGVLSNSFNTGGLAGTAPTNANQDIASGALPGPGNPCGYFKPVQVLQEDPSLPADDEGRAMLQEIHGVAPAAELIFAAGNISETATADNIFALAAAGAKIITDDVQFTTEPMFQDGIIANAVTAVVASGVSYFSAAMNWNQPDLAGNNVASWESPQYRAMPCPAAVAATTSPISHHPPVSCMNFEPDTAKPAVDAAGYEAVLVMVTNLQWSQPVGGVQTELAVFILDETPPGPPTIIGSGFQSSPQLPLAVTGAPLPGPTRTGVAIANFGGPPPRLKYVFEGSQLFLTAQLSSRLGDIVGPTIYGHNGTAAAMTVAAVPYDSTTTPEFYSSLGPNALYWEPASGLTPSPPLPAPQVLAKPDFTATDKVCTTMLSPGAPTGLGPSCPYRFHGTSAAAPNAAGVAALLLQAVPGLTPAQVRSTLASTASPMSGGSPYSTGAGLINAEAAIASFYSTTPAQPPAAQTSTQNQTAGTALPKLIKRHGLTEILHNGSRTNAGQQVRIRASAHLRGEVRLYKLITKKDGRVFIRTYGYRIRLTLIQSAPTAPGYDALFITKRYKL